MGTLVLIVVLFLVIGGALTFFAMKYQKKQEANIDWNALRSNSESIKQDLLNREAPFLKNWMQGKNIDAFTSAAIPSNLGDLAGNVVKQQLRESLTGSYKVQKESPAYMVLSGNEVHFFDTDLSGNVKEHLLLDAFSLKDASVEAGGAKKEMGLDFSKLAGDQAPKVINLKLSQREGGRILQAVDRLILQNSADMSGMLNGKNTEDMAKGRIIGEDFLKKLGEKYPNLKLSV